jgi:aspartyl protease family protein
VKAALGIMIAIGAAIGLLLPAGQKMNPAVAEPAPAAAAASAPAPGKAAPSPPATRGWAAETRLKPGPNGHFHTLALVNGQQVEFVVDTGATNIALTIEDARRIGIPVDPASFQVVGSGAGGPVRGQRITLDSVSVDGKEVRALQGAVLDGLDVSLLGQAYLSRITEVRMAGGEMILR